MRRRGGKAVKGRLVSCTEGHMCNFCKADIGCMRKWPTFVVGRLCSVVQTGGCFDRRRFELGAMLWSGRGRRGRVWSEERWTCRGQERGGRPGARKEEAPTRSLKVASRGLASAQVPVSVLSGLSGAPMRQGEQRHW